MKKLVLLSLPLLFLTGCSLTNNQPAEKLETIIVPVETSPTVSTTFDSSKIVLEGTEVSFEGFYHYKEISSFKNGSIGIQMGGQDGYGIMLIYTENGILVKTSDPIFWYDIGYTDKKINQYCIEVCNSTGCSKNKRTIDGVIGLENCPLVKTIDSCILDKNTGNAIDCINKISEYVFNLMQGNEVNNYFTERLEDFKNSL